MKATFLGCQNDEEGCSAFPQPLYRRKRSFYWGVQALTALMLVGFDRTTVDRPTLRTPTARHRSSEATLRFIHEVEPDLLVIGVDEAVVPLEVVSPAEVERGPLNCQPKTRVIARGF